MTNPSDNLSTNDNARSNTVAPAKFEAIKPTEVPLTTTYRSDSSSPSEYGNTVKTKKGVVNLWQQYPALFVALPIVLLALLGVIFVLPSQIETIKSQEAELSEPSSEAVTITPAGPTDSPWTDAQFAKQRRETQDILAELLDRQNQLETLHVNRWAQESFDQAVSTAAQADTFYREQDFQQAKTLYQQALEQFEALISNSEEIFTNNLENGFTAISQGDASAAKQHFEMAALIHSDSVEAKAGLQRAQVVDEVFDLIRQGSRHQRQNELDQAKALFEQAQKTDMDSSLARSKLSEIEIAIQDRDYNKKMSQGFAALNQDSFSQAIAEFQGALKIKPDAADAKAAITQAQNQKTQQSLQQFINKAHVAESDEQWQLAVDNYNGALKLDSNLVQAKVGKIKSEYRANIDRRLTSILKTPDRLTDEDVFNEYRQLGREVRDIPERTPRLQQQFDQLEQAMRRSIAPVNVTLQSDNQTDITVYQIGNLGQFNQHQLSLKPGKYTVVGTRNGYRDVRQEITISANTENDPVMVQCLEPINNG